MLELVEVELLVVEDVEEDELVELLVLLDSGGSEVSGLLLVDSLLPELIGVLVDELVDELVEVLST